MAKTKVAVLGGGLGSMAAAYELTCTESLRQRYEVTVYQQGWRLGGKGASGRNAARGQRIEEHGLHAFLGFYENAFALMRDLYESWARLRPTARWTSWRDAFEPQRMVSIQEWLPPAEGTTEAHARYSTWNISMPQMPGEPGDGQTVPLWDKLVMGAADLVVDWLRQILRREPKALSGLARELAHIELVHWRGSLDDETQSSLQAIGDALSGWEQDSRLDDDLRRLVLGVQLGAAILRGLIVDVLPRGEPEGFSYIDQWDFSAWLERHGASSRVSFWGPVRALYDLGFAYEGGGRGRTHARAAAGVALRILLLLGFGYKDAPLWKMKAGMGDVIFAPMYEVLRARGVRFEFFHRVENLGLSETGNLVERIDLSRQVKPKGDYDPLVWVRDLPCWPSEPHWDQIVDGERIRDRLRADGLTLESAWCSQSVGQTTLELGKDYDQVVLGISVAALKDVARELIDQREPWRKMIATTGTVQTQALQLWLDRDTASLGWKAGTTIMTGYVEPFDTWGDLSHLLSEEHWPEPGGPRSLAYFCNALPDADPIPPYTDPTFPATQLERVFDDAKQYLQNHIGHLWPEATAPGDPNALDWNRLYDPSGGSGSERLWSQYLRANIDPTERYVLSLPGSLQHRLWAGRSGFLNLFLAGDWVQTSLNGGSAEAAVEGGLRAAHAMIGRAPRPFVARHVHDDVTPAEGD